MGYQQVNQEGNFNHIVGDHKGSLPHTITSNRRLSVSTQREGSYSNNEEYSQDKEGTPRLD